VTDVDATGREPLRDPLPAGADQYIPAVQQLLEAGRAARTPVFYSTNQYRADGRDMIGWKHKSWRAESHCRRSTAARALHSGRGPAAGRLDHLQAAAQRLLRHPARRLPGRSPDRHAPGGRAVDERVRARHRPRRVLLRFRTIVVEECTFDRATVSHKVNLFDMHQKYADVTPLGEVLDYLRRLACSGSPASS
jgi:hypothetical protein